MSEAPPPPPLDLRGVVVGVHSGMIAISSLSVLVRIYTRTRIAKWIGLDDIFICTAFLLAILEASAAIVAVNYGLGQHSAIQPPENLEPFGKTLLISIASYTVAIMFVKLSLLAFYVSLSTKKTFRIAVYTMMGVSVAFGVGSAGTIIFQCVPISHLWDLSAEGTCINDSIFYYANAGINIATEILIYALPIPTVWSLHLPMVQKIGVLAAFGVGMLAILAGIRGVNVLHASVFWTDQCWNAVDPLLYATIELHLAVLASCIPIFKDLLRRWLPDVIRTNHNRHAAGDDEDGDSRQPSSAFLRSSSAGYLRGTPRQSMSYSLSSVKRNSTFPRPSSALQHGPSYRKSTSHSVSSATPAESSKLGTGTQTTINCTEGFRYSRKSESEERIITPTQGIMAHTSVHVEHEEAVGVEKRLSLSNRSSLDGQFIFS